MRKDIQPGNWESAAALVVNEIATKWKNHPISISERDSEISRFVESNFDEIVDLTFHTKDVESGYMENMFFNLAVAGLHGYSLVAKEDQKASAAFVYNTVVGKQKMYGHGNIARFEVPGIVIRMNDKLERLKNLKGFDGPVLFEPVKDTWLDICGYSIIAIMWMRGWFLLDMKNQDTEKSGEK